MNITEKIVNESNVDEVTKLIYSGQGMIRLDKEDVKNVLVGKVGMLYQAIQEEGVDNGSFMQKFFDELQKKEEAKNSTNLLLCIGMSQEDPLMMEDMVCINEYLDTMENEAAEIKWGQKLNDEGCRMSLLAVCTREKKI